MSKRGNTGSVDASLFGVSDTEMLGIINDVADENGWATTLAVRFQLGEREDAKRSGVGVRLAWLARYGWIEKGERTKVPTDGESWRWSQCWRLTAMGTVLLHNPRVSKTVENALAKLNPAQRVELTRELGEHGAGAASEVRNAIRRQWQRSMRMK